MYLGMPTTVEDRDGERNRRVSPESFFFTKMYFYGRELCFLFAIIFTTYAALQNAPPKVSKSPSAEPFFAPTSLVADFYQGNLLAAFHRITESDIAFIMYYAPWDAESQITRDQFITATQFFYREVYFAAINCWQPRSECRQYFTKLSHFPVFIAYTQHSKGVQYRGPKHAANMVCFLRHIMRPIVRVEKPVELQQLLAQHDAVVVGHFSFAGSLGASGYHTFYATALKYLEHDPQREVAFAVTTNSQAAASLGVNSLPAVTLHLWNETVEYPRDAEFTSQVLTKWILENIHQVTLWLSPPGVKSLTLSPFVEGGPVLILFTPRNPLQNYNYYYDLLREVGLEYHNCDNNLGGTRLLELLYRNRQSWKHSLQHDEYECQQWKSLKQHRLVCDCEKPVSVILETQMINHSSLNNAACRNRDFIPSSTNCLEMGIQRSSVFDSYYQAPCMWWCGEDDYNEENITYHRKEERLGADPFSPEELIAAWKAEKCRLLQWARELHTSVLPPVTPMPISGDLHSGLACRTNLSLSLLAMDSLHFHHFAEGLGVGSTVETATVIFNAATESTYVMEGNPSKGMLVDFIVNFTQGSLKRTLRSCFPSQQLCKHRHSDLKHQICVEELTSITFHQSVMKSGQDVVLMYYSPFCAFCQGVSHIFLTVAHYFHNVPGLSFARIDGENNDLAWQFTVHKYPSVLFFPAHRKSESRVFPHHLPITAPNLVVFVLSNLEPGPRRLIAVASLCAGWFHNWDLQGSRNCVARTRKENLVAIEAMLAEVRANLRWRDVPVDLQSGRRLLISLQKLRQLHLQLAAADFVTENHVQLAAASLL